MHLDQLKKEVLYLSFSRKLVLFGTVLSFVLLLFPWGTHGVPKEGSFEFVAEKFGAFGLLPVFGWVLLFLGVGNLFLLGQEILKKQESFCKVSNSLWWLILGVQGIFVLIIALFVLNAALFRENDTQYRLGIGIFLLLFAQALVVLGGVFGKKEGEKKYMKESLSRPYEVDTSRTHLEPEAPQDQMSLGDYE